MNFIRPVLSFRRDPTQEFRSVHALYDLYDAVRFIVLARNRLGCTCGDLETRRKALNDLLAEQWEYNMRTSPIYASILGDKRYNDKVDDFSQKAIDDGLADAKKFLDRFEAIDTTGFPEQEILNKKLMVRDLKMTLESARFKPWEMPVSQFGGVHVDMPQLVSVLSFQNVKDYEDYIARLKQMPRYFDENMIQMRKGMAEGLMPGADPVGESCYAIQRVSHPNT